MSDEDKATKIRNMVDAMEIAAMIDPTYRDIAADILERVPVHYIIYALQRDGIQSRGEESE